MVDTTLGIAFWTIMKFGLLAFLFLYILFAGVVIKQISIMTQTVKMGFESFIKIIGILHFIFAVCVFILSITML